MARCWSLEPEQSLLLSGENRKGVHEVAMGDARLGTAFDQLRIGQARDQLCRREVVNEDLVGAGASGELSVGRERDRENWIQAFGKRLPLNGAGDGEGSFRALIDPQFEQTQFVR